MDTRELHGTPYHVAVHKHHAYSLDTILLAYFASSRIHSASKIIDLGTGNGVLMLYMSLYTKAKITGYDITPSLVEVANENIKRNHLEHKINVIHQDIKTIESLECDCIISNPPYFKYQKETNISKVASRSIARFEIEMTIEDIFRIAKSSLKTKQSLIMIHRSERLDEFIIIANKYHMQLKEMRYVHAYKDKPSEVVLLHFIKNAKQELKVLPPLILYDAPHVFSSELQKIYQGDFHVT